MKRMADPWLYVSAAGFAAGIFVHSFVSFGSSFSALFLFLGAVLFLFRRGGKRQAAGPGETPRRLSALAAVFLVAFGLGLFRFDLADWDGAGTALDHFAGTTATLSGTVSEEPDAREQSVLVTLDASSARSEGGKPAVPVRTRVLLSVDFYPKLRYGDELSVRGLIETPKSFGGTDGGRSFDYRAYLAKDGIYYAMYRPRVGIITRGKGNPVKAALFSLKDGFVRNVGALIPEPEASLLGGLVVGAKQSLGKALLDEFRVAGVVHIVVLSGYNITIVADFIMRALSFLPRFFGMAFGSLGILLFAVMTGASATVVRATIMALLVIFAQATGRTYRVARALLLAGTLMIAQNPRILVFDASFELSFLSTLALIYVSPLVARRLSFLPERWKIREIVTATLSTQIFVLPFLLYQMGLLSLVSLPVNLLILPFIPATMLAGFLAGVLPSVGNALALPFAYAAHFLLGYELAVVEFASRLPFAALVVPSFPLVAMASSYALYAAALFLLWQKERRREEKSGRAKRPLPAP